MRFLGLAFVLAFFACLLFALTPVVAQEQVEEQKQEEQDEDGEEKEDGEEDGEGEGGEEEKEEAKDEYSQVYMKDNTYVEGIVNLDNFEIETEYGKLIVPREHVVKIRIGKNADKELKEKIDSLIGKLADEEFKVREDATKALGELGAVALEELRDATQSDDVEVKTRAEKLVREIEQSIPPDSEEIIDDDEIVARKFTIRGTLLVDKFVIKTRYGTITAEKKDVKTLVVSKASFFTKTIVVSGSSNSGSDQMLDTGINLRKGEKVIVKAKGTVHIRSYGITASPDGSSNRSSHYSGIPIGGLMGKIGPSGRLFKVGSRYTGVADQNGRLYLAVAVRSGYSTTGDFRVTVQVEKK
jgi:hypothetical protein